MLNDIYNLKIEKKYGDPYDYLSLISDHIDKIEAEEVIIDKVDTSVYIEYGNIIKHADSLFEAAEYLTGEEQRIFVYKALFNYYS